MANNLYYAWTRSIDAGTGDAVFTGSTWAQGQSMAEVVARTLRTPKGAYLPDPSYGVDYSMVGHARPGVAAAFRASILDGLARFVRAGRLKDLTVTVTQTGSQLLWDVAFTDPRADSRGRVTGQL